MTEIQSILERARLLIVQHAPSEALQDAVPFALVCLIAGIGISVLGAKLSRFGLTAVVAMAGAAAGIFVGREIGYPESVCGLVGALMAGVVAFMTFRLWVGMVAAVVLSSAALGVFGYQHILPHVGAFEASYGTTVKASVADGSFALPTPQDQQAFRERTPQRWAQDLWTFAAKKDANLTRNGRALGLVTFLGGLFFGVIAMRTALIISTALVGTGLVATATGTLLTSYWPQSYQSFQNNPAMIGMAFGAFFVGSLVLQTLLTRKPPKPKEKSKS